MLVAAAALLPTAPHALAEDCYRDSLGIYYDYRIPILGFTIPVYDQIGDCTRLTMIDNLSSLPPDVFRGLSNLQTLYLHDNNLICLPELPSSLTHLEFDENFDTNRIDRHYRCIELAITVSDSELGSGKSAMVTVSFSNNVTGVTSDELTVSAGSITNLSGSGSIYTARLIPPRNSSGSITLRVPAGVAQDDAGNRNSALHHP